MYTIRVSPDFKPTAYTDVMTAVTNQPRACSIARALDIVGEKWALLAVREVFLGNRRFDEMIRRTGAPRDTLAARLRTLVASGILERRQYSEHPARYEYRLDRGRPRSLPGDRHADALGRQAPSGRGRAAPGPRAPLRASPRGTAGVRVVRRGRRSQGYHAGYRERLTHRPDPRPPSRITATVHHDHLGGITATATGVVTDAVVIQWALR